MMSEGIRKVEQLMFKLDMIQRETLKIKEIKSSIREAGLISPDDSFGLGWLSDTPKDKKQIEAEFLRAVKSEKLNELKLRYFRAEQDLVQTRKQLIVPSRDSGARPEEGADPRPVPCAVRGARPGAGRAERPKRSAFEAKAPNHALRIRSERRTEITGSLSAPLRRLSRHQVY